MKINWGRLAPCSRYGKMQPLENILFTIRKPLARLIRILPSLLKGMELKTKRLEAIWL